MADLARALVALQSVAETRRIARKSLRDAAETIATAINDRLRRGDRITLENGVVYGAATLYWLEREGHDRLSRSERATQVLTRNGVALHDARWLSHDLRQLDRAVQYILEDYADVPYAGPSDDLAFANEAEAVIQAFAGQLKVDATTAQQATHTLVRIAPQTR